MFIESVYCVMARRPGKAPNNRDDTNAATLGEVGVNTLPSERIHTPPVAVFQQIVERHMPYFFTYCSAEQPGLVQIFRCILTQADRYYHLVYPSGQYCTILQPGTPHPAPFVPMQCPAAFPFYPQLPVFDPILCRNVDVMRKISLLFLTVCRQLGRGVAPHLEYESPGTDWDDFVMDNDGVLAPIRGRQRRSTLALYPERNAAKFVGVVKILGRIYTLLKHNRTATLRDLFYDDVPFFVEQDAVVNAINIITLMLRVPRHYLNVSASEKALVAGHLSFRDSDVIYDCMHTYQGIAIPATMEHVEILPSDAQVIFVVEKDATFRHLIEDGICTPAFPIPCIVMTGKGYPDYSIRLFLQKLWTALRIPIYILTDSDPHGIDIMCTYRYGSKAQHYDNLSMALPSVRWLGVLPSDWDHFGIDRRHFSPLRNDDKMLARDILQRPYCSPELKREIELLLESGHKAELQNVQSVRPGYFVHTYLVHKMQMGVSI